MKDVLKRLMTPMRVVVSVGLIAWLISGIDTEQAWDRLARADFRWLLIVHLLTPFTMACGVWKWKLLLRAHGHDVGTWPLFRFYMLGQFANNFMPSNVGGDVLRVVMVTRHTGAPWAESTGSVLVERVTGLVALFLALIGGMSLHWDWVTELGLVWPVLISGLGVAVACALVFSPASGHILTWMRTLPLVSKPAGLLTKLHEACMGYYETPVVLWHCMWISLVFYVLMALQMWMLCWTFPTLDADWTTQLVIFGVISLVSLLPISINGFGLQESTYVILLLSLGFAQDEALVVALGFRGILLVSALSGAIVFAAGGLSRAEIGRQVAQAQKGD